MQHAKLQTPLSRLAQAGATRHADRQLTRWNFDGITDLIHPLPDSDLNDSFLIWIVQTVDVDSNWYVHEVLFCGNCLFENL